MKKMLFFVSALSMSVALFAKVERKAASEDFQPEPLHNCRTVLKAEKNIPSCTDLVPCSSGNIVKKGSRWMDEDQDGQVYGVWVNDKQLCVDKFTDEVKKDACCGG